MDFTAKQLADAIEFVNQKYHIEGGHFEIAWERYHEETLKAFQDVFWVDEPICKSLGLDWSEEVAHFHMKVIKENLTLLAVNDTNGEIMGIRIISTSDKDNGHEPTVFNDGNVNKLFTLLGHVSEKADVYSHYGVTRAIEFVAVGVKTKYRKQGLGTKLMAAAVDLVKQLDVDNACITSLGTSKYTQLIFERLGFDNLYELKYEDYMVDGETVIQNTGEHEKIVCYAMKI